MRWLSKGAEALVKKAGEAAEGEAIYDVAVIGSGYGGAVTACRLAQAGFSVCVLERGDEYVPGEFPNDLSDLPGHVRMERADRAGVIGNKNALFDIRLHGSVTTLVGNALGGTSQINANVALRADPALFREPNWPTVLREHYDPLDPYYTLAEQMLGVTPYPHECAKATQLSRLAGPVNDLLRTKYWTDEVEPKARWYKPPLAVNHLGTPNAANRHGFPQSPCNGCGDCVTGCNVGAKNTLTTNYLPLAYKAGAHLYTGVNVLTVKPGQGFVEIRFMYTDQDWAAVLGVEPDGRLRYRREDLTKCMRARHAVVAAGALGSTEILLRSRHAHDLSFSPRLGKGFSGNGDALHFGVDQDKPVNAV